MHTMPLKVNFYWKSWSGYQSKCICLWIELERLPEQVYLLMDRAYEGDKMRAKATEKGFIPIVPPKKNRKEPWDYDRKRYKQRNEIERYFLRLKRFRKIFTRYDKLDIVFSGFICFAMICDALFCVNRLKKDALKIANYGDRKSVV